MPYSKTLKFVHVAIPKTGTTSMVLAMKGAQETRGGELTLLNDWITPEFRKKYRLNKIRDPHPKRAKHLSALQLNYILGDQEFERCFKFSIVRNPWARMVTRYFFTHVDNEPNSEEKRRKGTLRKFHNLDFEPWLIRRWERNKRKKNANTQLRKLVDLDGRLMVDYVGRLEKIQESLDFICDTIGVERMKMPHVNGTRRGHYAQFYNERTKEIVADMCRDDIEHFNFSFEQE